MTVPLFINLSQALFLLFWVVVYLLPLWFMVHRHFLSQRGSASGNANSQQNQPLQTRIQYFAMPLLIEWEDAENVDASFEQTVIFLRQGRVRIGNTLFERGDEIDHSFNGAHAYRMLGSDRLMIRSAQGERYDVVYRHFIFRGYAWIRLVHRTY